MVSNRGNKKEILYVAAFDKNGILVKAKDAEKTGEYFCPECKDKLILKKSGNTGKGSKRPHFAHHAESPNCTPEGVLHKSFKLLLLQYIKEHIADETLVNIEWVCSYCHEKHTGNLVQYATDAIAEYQMGNCRADIALLGQEGKPIAVIEIVVTHKPEETAIAYYKDNKIVLIQIELESEDDLDRIEAKINKPTSIDYCFNHRCPNIGDYAFQRGRKLVVRNCGNFHQMLSIEAGIFHYFGAFFPQDLTDVEIEFAKSKGVLFEGKTVICPHCRRLRRRYNTRPRIF
jgi:ssDNA-binding Zn-finger/Zn-ribbon topoisomerase 1